jgi:hypothetical protein
MSWIIFLRYRNHAVAAVLLGLLLISLTQSIATASQYELPWHTIDGGGGTSSGGQYVLTGTIGQPDAAYSTGH